MVSSHHPSWLPGLLLPRLCREGEFQGVPCSSFQIGNVDVPPSQLCSRQFVASRMVKDFRAALMKGKWDSPSRTRAIMYKKQEPNKRSLETKRGRL
jgi:hypothetical protein